MIFLVLAIGVIGAMLALYAAFRVPAHDGVDQNGYLVAGRMLSRHGAPVVSGVTSAQPDPFRFAGAMWVGTDLQTPTQRYYPKYPVGMPAAYAMTFSIGGDNGLELAYWLNPICMALALLVSFLLIRRFTGSLPAFLALIILATSPLTLGLANNPNSHALALLLATTGMLAALLWSQGAGLWAAITAGLLLGLAASVRYTEVLFVLPASLAVADRLSRQHDRRNLLAAGAMLLPFILIIACVVILNHHHWTGTLTGYSATRESTLGLAFRLEHLRANLPVMLRQLHDSALAYILPFALAGIVWLFRSNWRLATILLAWVLPTFLVYSLYYWAPQREGTSVGYLRFILSTLPAILLCAAWLLSRALLNEPTRNITTLAAGVIVAAAALSGLSGGLRLIAADQRHRLMLADNASHITRALDNIPESAAVFCSERGLLNHLQAALPHENLYDAALFEPGRVLRMIDDPDTGKPEGPDPNRRAAFREWILARLQPRSAAVNGARSEELRKFLDEEKRTRVASLLASGQRVLFIQSSRSSDAPAPIDPQFFSLHTLATWRPYILPVDDPNTDMDEAWLPTWRIVEVIAPAATSPAHPPSTQPRTRPATRPAAPPVR